MSEVRLPDTIWLRILGHLEHQDLVSVIQLEREVNWFVCGIAKDKTLWKNVLWKASKPKYIEKLTKSRIIEVLSDKLLGLGALVYIRHW